MESCKNGDRHGWRAGRDFDYCVGCGLIRGAADPVRAVRQIRHERRISTLLATLLARHGPVCSYCGRRCFITLDKGRPDELTVDHVWPLSKGGGRGIDNCVLACRACNEAKGDMEPSEWAQARLDAAAALGGSVVSSGEPT